MGRSLQQKLYGYKFFKGRAPNVKKDMKQQEIAFSGNKGEKIVPESAVGG